MNPQDQDQQQVPPLAPEAPIDTPDVSTQPTPVPTAPLTTPEVPSSPEADAAALKAIDALESEGTTTPTDPVDAAPVETPLPDDAVLGATSATPITLEPTPASQPIAPAANPAETSAAGVAAALGAQQAAQAAAPSTPAPQAPVNTTALGSTEKKAPNKLIIILGAAVVVLILAIGGFFVWQSMNATSTPTDTTDTTTETGGDLPGGNETEVEGTVTN